MLATFSNIHALKLIQVGLNETGMVRKKVPKPSGTRNTFQEQRSGCELFVPAVLWFVVAAIAKPANI
jgi:hypothetical protein